jgi:hypothetical protein
MFLAAGSPWEQSPLQSPTGRSALRRRLARTVNCRPYQLSPHRCVLSLLSNALMFVLFITYYFITFLLYFRSMVRGSSGRRRVRRRSGAHISRVDVHADCTEYAKLIAHCYLIVLYVYLYLYCFVLFCFAVYLLCLCIVTLYLQCIYSILFICILFSHCTNLFIFYSMYILFLIYIFYFILFSVPNNNATVKCAHLHARRAGTVRRLGGVHLSAL